MVDLLICYSIDFWIFICLFIFLLLFYFQLYKLPKSFCVQFIMISFSVLI